MCCKNNGCQKLEALKGKPGECTPEQVEKCHGEVKCHPCVKVQRQSK